MGFVRRAVLLCITLSIVSVGAVQPKDKREVVSSVPLVDGKWGNGTAVMAEGNRHSSTDFGEDFLPAAASGRRKLAVPCNTTVASSGCTICNSASTRCTTCNSTTFLAGGLCYTATACAATGGVYTNGGSVSSNGNNCDKCDDACSGCGAANSNNKCSKCATGYYQSASSGGWITCKACGTGCQACSGTATNCQACASGNYLTGSSCGDKNSCTGATYADDATRTCAGCDAACTRCSSATSCSKCASGFFLTGTSCVVSSLCPYGSFPDSGTGTCATCDAACAACSGSGTKACSACNTGYFLNGTSSCLGTVNCGNGAPANCDKCQTDQKTCVTCLATYTLVPSSNTCAPCPSNVCEATWTSSPHSFSATDVQSVAGQIPHNLWATMNLNPGSGWSTSNTLLVSNNVITITSTACGTVTYPSPTYPEPIPDNTITFADPNVCTGAPLSNNKWTTTSNDANNAILNTMGTAAGLVVPSSCNLKSGNVVWTAKFTGPCNLAVQIQWAMSHWSTCTTSYGNPLECVASSLKAGTPLACQAGNNATPKTNDLLGGGTGGDGSNWTGSYSPTDSITLSTCKAPGSLTCPANATQTVASTVNGTAVTYTTPSTPTGFTSVACVPASGSNFAIGTTTVNCTATDSSGLYRAATCPFTVNVTRASAPGNLTCPANVAKTVAYTANSTAVTYTTPNPAPSGYSDVSCLPASGSNFAIGITTVNCTATDSSNVNSVATCPFTVNVTDASPPGNFTCPANKDVTVASSNTVGTTVRYTEPSTPSGYTNVTCTPPGGSTFSIGTTTVTCTATDRHVNPPVTCLFVVTVTNCPTPHCFRCNATACLACETNYILSNGSCIQPQEPPSECSAEPVKIVETTCPDNTLSTNILHSGVTVDTATFFLVHSWLNNDSYHFEEKKKLSYAALKYRNRTSDVCRHSESIALTKVLGPFRARCNATTAVGASGSVLVTAYYHKGTLAGFFNDSSVPEICRPTVDNSGSVCFTTYNITCCPEPQQNCSSTPVLIANESSCPEAVANTVSVETLIPGLESVQFAVNHAYPTLYSAADPYARSWIAVDHLKYPNSTEACPQRNQHDVAFKAMCNARGGVATITVYVDSSSVSFSGPLPPQSCRPPPDKLNSDRICSLKYKMQCCRSDSDPEASADPWFVGLHQQRFLFKGEDSTWYNAIYDPAKELTVNMMFHEYGYGWTFIDAMAFVVGEHKFYVRLVDPYNYSPKCKNGEAVCLANGAIAIDVDGETLMQPGLSMVGQTSDYHITALNIPFVCKPIADGHLHWQEQTEAVKERRLREGRSLEDMMLRIMTSERIFDEDKCTDWMLERTINGDTLEQTGTMASVFIQTPVGDLRLEFFLHDHSADDWVNHQRFDWSLSNYEPSKTGMRGVVGETSILRKDRYGFDIVRDRQLILSSPSDEDYVVDGPYGHEFKALKPTPTW